VPKIAMTDVSVRALQPPETGRNMFWDKSFPGFGLRISQGGAKAWVMIDPRSRRRTKETIGRYPVIDLKTARSEAKRRLAEYTPSEGRRRAL
jgi:hypothetical protein